MTWLDFLVIGVFLVFAAVGARLGSLWMGACLLGGFLGAFLADYYALPFGQMLGGFAGSTFIAGTVLYIGGVIVPLIPGYFLSKISSILFLGIIDSAIGLLAGAFTGLVAISLILILIVPISPKIERSDAWKESSIVKPLHRSLEDMFNKKLFNKSAFKKELKKEAKKHLKPLKKKAKKEIEDLSDKIIEEITE